MILLVDDNDRNLRFMRDILQRHGYRVEVANDAHKALVRVKEASYRLLLLDVQMPTVSGTELMRHLKAGGLEAPVIAVTAMAMRGDEADLLAAGFDGYLSKPFSYRALLDKVEQALAWRAPGQA